VRSDNSKRDNQDILSTRLLDVRERLKLFQNTWRKNKNLNYTLRGFIFHLHNIAKHLIINLNKAETSCHTMFWPASNIFGTTWC